MGQQHKRLATSAPAAASNTTVYTAPASANACTLVSSIHICNTNTVTSDKVRVFIVPNGSAAAVGNAIIFDLVIPPSNPFAQNTAVDLNASDFISVYSLNGTSTFTISGLEIT